ncbi:MAG: hypothetical protein PF444_08185, partial [Bacteroidales bacterium]|nr:hypothetical protein [Bacteroidales bacterium]
PFVHRNNIAVARRISGGGTVFHDLGNLNYSYITSCANLKADYYALFNQKTLDVLAHLGLKDLSFQRNNIFCEGKKISGVAQYKRGKRMVHHGTLLVDADLKQLRALFTVKDYYQTKGVASVSSSVANVNTFVDLTMTDVTNAFKFSCVDKLELISSDNEVADMAQYYCTKEWIFGKSPKYALAKSALYIEVDKGRIKHMSDPLFFDLIGLYHSYEELAPVCDDVDFLF